MWESKNTKKSGTGRS